MNSKRESLNDFQEGNLTLLTELIAQKALNFTNSPCLGTITDENIEYIPFGESISRILKLQTIFKLILFLRILVI